MVRMLSPVVRSLWSLILKADDYAIHRRVGVSVASILNFLITANEAARETRGGGSKFGLSLLLLHEPHGRKGSHWSQWWV